jgi:hypothetical protein
MSILLPSQEELQALFNYDKVTGLFTYKVKPNFRIKVGSIAGTVKASGRCKGYCFIKINGQLYQASRLAWMYVYGQDPGYLTIDHIDRNPSNNAISNLRLATQSQQSFNRSYKSSSGYRGVSFVKSTGKYLARINFRKAGISTTKQFNTAEEASAWYEEQRSKYGKEYCYQHLASTTDDTHSHTIDWFDNQPTESVCILPKSQEEVQEHTVLRTKVSRSTIKA